MNEKACITNNRYFDMFFYKDMTFVYETETLVNKFWKLIKTTLLLHIKVVNEQQDKSTNLFLVINNRSFFWNCTWDDVR